MVNPVEFRDKVRSTVAQEYDVEFLGKNFDEIVNKITETRASKIYAWLDEVVNQNVQPIVIGSKKKYKDWAVNQLLTFRHPFKIGNTAYRILFVKVKNSIYIEFHLGDHKYYDKVRKSLDLKRG